MHTKEQLEDAARAVFERIKARDGKPSAERWTAYGSDDARLVCDAMRLELRLIVGADLCPSDEIMTLAYLSVRKSNKE